MYMVREVNHDIEKIKKFAKEMGIYDQVEKKFLESNTLPVIKDDIFSYWNFFREIYIQTVNKSVANIYKSPCYGTSIKTNNDIILYSYERNIECEIIEGKAYDLREHNIDWADESILYSSGMAALTSLISNYIHMISNNKDKITILVWGAYYETRMFFDYIKGKNIEWLCCNTESELIENIHRDFDIIFIEPVKYDWNLEVLNIPHVLEFVLEQCVKIHKHRLLLFDSTLVAEELPMTNILGFLRDAPYLLVANFNSMLKLHQQGLELTNAGLITLYSSYGQKDNLDIRKISLFCKKMRTIFGKGLRVQEILMLDNPFSFNRSEVLQYSKVIFLNNALLANTVNTIGIFEKISHPSLQNNNFSWAKAPFVVFILKEDCLKNYSKLISIIQYEANVRELPLVYGSSFGFRHCRFEIIIPNLNNDKGIFKIAMGHVLDKQRDEIIQLICELGEYKDFTELENKYKDVRLGGINLENLE